jgi:DNA-binding response OmpR family regulator
MVRVLVIEDNEDFRELTRHWLEEAGFSVTTLPNGRLGLELQRVQPADIVVTDLLMPDQDGIETIFALRKEFPAVKIIAMSGRESLTGYDILRVADELGAVKTFKKPFHLDDLVQAVRELAVS